MSAFGASSDWLLALIAEITGETPSGVGDELRLTEDLHLDSLGRVQLAAALEERLGVAPENGLLEARKRLGICGNWWKARAKARGIPRALTLRRKDNRRFFDSPSLHSGSLRMTARRSGTLARRQRPIRSHASRTRSPSRNATSIRAGRGSSRSNGCGRRLLNWSRSRWCGCSGILAWWLRRRWSLRRTSRCSSSPTT